LVPYQPINPIRDYTSAHRQVNGTAAVNGQPLSEQLKITHRSMQYIRPAIEHMAH
jgi:hypothetical protein